MTTKYCDHGLYGAYTSTPTWGVAQDGDGSAKTAATPATCAVVFTGVPEIGSIAVLGVTLSPSWVTSADVCANNLATAINASSSTATSPVGITNKSQVRNHLFARGPAGGAPTGTCQIMMRQGTAEVNGQVAITHTLDSVSSPGTITFSGGFGGAWGYFFNEELLWPSSSAISSYGILATNPPFVGDIPAGQRIVVRSGKTLTYTTSVFTATWSALGNSTEDQPVVVVIDDGTEWPADLPNPELRLLHTGYLLTITAIANHVQIEATRYSDSEYGFVIDLQSVNVNDFNLGRNIEFSGTAIKKLSYFLRINLGTDYLINENFVKAFRKSLIATTQTTTEWFSYPNNSSARHTLVLEDTILDNTGAVTPNLGVFGSRAQSTYTNTRANGVRFANFVAGSRLQVASGDSREQTTLFRNCDFGNVSERGPNNLLVAVRRVFAGASQYGTRDFFIDTMFGFVDWTYVRGFPTCNARLLDGVTPWSIRFQPSTVSGRNGRFKYVETPRISTLNSLGDGVKTIAMEVAVHEDLPSHKAAISMVVEYIDTSGNQHVEDTYDLSGAATDVSTATWSQQSGGQVTFVTAVTQYHDKKKLSLTTEFPVAANSEIGVYVRYHDIALDNTQTVFIDPDVQVSAS